MIEDNKKIVYDEIEQSIIDSLFGEEKKILVERFVQAKLKRAAKIAKALSKE